MMIYKFLKYINSTDVGSTYYNVAHYVANNFAKVVDMNLEELADACYVSQATISRFCRTVGYENFSHFKLESQMALEDGLQRINSITSFLDDADDDVEYKTKFTAYNQRIADSLMASINNMNVNKVDELLEAIISTEDVALFGIHRCSSVIQELQFCFALKSKFVKAFSGTPHQLEYAQNLTKDSLAIVLTADDYFTKREKEVMAVLEQKQCKKFLITTAGINHKADIFDEVFVIGTGLGDCGKYVMMNYSEVLISRFFTKY